MPTVPPTIDEIIAAIRERDSGKTFHEHTVLRWDTALSDEIDRLKSENAKLWRLLNEPSVKPVEMMGTVS
jgi:hypothetical protein